MSRSAFKLKVIVSVGVALTLLLALAGVAAAAVISGGTIIPAPASVVNSTGAGGAGNLQQEAFNERQGVTLPVAVATDSGIIPAGTVVDSHMIFLNKPDGVGGIIADVGRIWTFDNAIIGVMSNSNGSLEVASSPILGAPGTIYPGAPFGARGMEGGDSYTVSGNSIKVTMRVAQPGDWIRVVTRSCQKGSVLSGSGVEGKGIGKAPGLGKNFNPKSQACGNAGKNS